MKQASYQPEIDGLRAFAVLGVVLFHLGFQSIPGGYVGVDVFFVISGFLITRLIVDEFEQRGSFKFSHFYVRRVRRLFPALFFTLAVCFVAGVAILPPGALERLGSSTIHAILSVSNIFFWSETGYFDLDAARKPLIHTWSLSVEEQFYLVWPVTIVALCRISRLGVAGIRTVVVLIGLSSLLAAEYYYDISASAVFYLAPFRAYEFMLGAALVWAPKKFHSGSVLLEVMLLVGLAMIFYSMLSFDASTRFPGYSALVPTIGTALAIYAYDAKYVGELLRNRVAVGIGLISYSLYLVHWPIIVYYQLLTNTLVTAASGIYLGLGALVLAGLMYRYVEQPFRRRRSGVESVPPARVGLVAAAFTLVLVYASSLLLASDGWPGRIQGKLPEAVDISNVPAFQTWAMMKSLEGRPFAEGNKLKIHIIGDSQAADFVNILTMMQPAASFQLTTTTMDVWCGAIFVPKDRREDYFESNVRVQTHKNTEGIKSHCLNQWRLWEGAERLREADYVVLSNLWYDYQLPYLADTIRLIQSLSPAQIIVVGNKSLPLDSQEIATRCALLSVVLPMDCADSIDGLNRFAAKFLSSGIENDNTDYLAINEGIKTVGQTAGIQVLDMYEVLCGPELASCTIYDDAGIATYKDHAHVNLYGARIFVQRLMERKFLAGTHE